MRFYLVLLVFLIQYDILSNSNERPSDNADVKTVIIIMIISIKAEKSSSGQMFCIFRKKRVIQENIFKIDYVIKRNIF